MNHPGPRLLSLVLLATAAIGCMPEDELDAAGGIETGDDDLVLPPDGHVRLWPGGVIPFCQGTQPRNAIEQREQRHAYEQIRAAFNATWGSVARVSLGFCQHPTMREDKVVVRLWAGKHHNDIGGSAGLGAMATNSVTLWYCSPSQGGSNCSQRADGTYVDHDAWFRAAAIHEFGHVLGFLHEHQRNDVPIGVSRWCDHVKHSGRTQHPGNNGIISGSRYLSPSYDAGSIMNYCRDQDLNNQKDEVWNSVIDRLSPGDVAGVAQTYGRR